MEEREFKSGFVSIIGRPNVGKSTLLNAILGEKIAITTPKPQTTRNRITGIKNVTGAQIVFWDTPGIHKARDLMNRAMVKTAISTITEVDIILFVVEADQPLGKGDQFIVSLLKEVKTPVFLLLNKVDLCSKGELLQRIGDISSRYSFDEIIPVSAKSGEGVETLLGEVYKKLSPGPRYFPDDIVTDNPERFIVSELIREQIFYQLKDELPYQAAVEVESFKEDEKKGVIVINAVVYVERDAHKGIILGKQGKMIKRIGTRSRSEIELLLGAKVFLELFVKVRSGWSQSGRMLKDLGIDM